MSDLTLAKLRPPTGSPVVSEPQLSVSWQPRRISAMNMGGGSDADEAQMIQVALFSGGHNRVDGQTEDPEAVRRIAESLGLLLQVKNFSILMGAGASFHLGAPRIRGLSIDETAAFLRASPSPPTDQQVELARILGGETVDLEKLLSALSASIAYATTVGCDPVPIRDAEASLGDLESLRASINQALVAACDLPRSEQEDPWRSHREFFRKVLRSRRSD